MSEIDINNLKELSRTCVTISEISKKINLSYSKTRNLLNKHNLNHFKRGQRKKDTSERSFRMSKDQLFEMYVTRNMSLRQIGKDVGVSYQAVHNWLRAYEIEAKNTGRNKNECLYVYLRHKGKVKSEISSSSALGFVCFTSIEYAKEYAVNDDSILKLNISKLVRTYPEVIIKKNIEDDNGDIQLKILTNEESFNILKSKDKNYKILYVIMAGQSIPSKFLSKV